MESKTSPKTAANKAKLTLEWLPLLEPWIREPVRPKMMTKKTKFKDLKDISKMESIVYIWSWLV